MDADIAIRMQGVWKRYGLPWPQWLGRGQQWLHSISRGWGAPAWEGDPPWVLQDINLELRRGETLAIVGRNGASKSTLLKILAGVTPPTRGQFEVRGRLFPMIEITGGLHQELTGRENIRLIGAILGLSRRELTVLMPDIEEFTELGPWLEQPVRTYSTGMLARLGFGVGACIHSDVVLIDEALSVGDLRFQNKCLERIKEMHEQGAAIVLVTHNLDTAQFIAQRGLVLDKGRIIAQGSAMEALRVYEQLVFHGNEQGGKSPANQGSQATVKILGAGVYGPDGTLATEIGMGSPFAIEVECELHRPVPQPLFSLAIINAAGITCVWNISVEDGLHCGEARGRLRLRAWYGENRLMKGYYRVDFAVQTVSSFKVVEQLAGVASFSVVGSGRARGVVAMSPRWELSAAVEAPSVS
jgi:lipopolysaccharide transport system ATP-binding protein